MLNLQKVGPTVAVLCFLTLSLIDQIPARSSSLDTAPPSGIAQTVLASNYGYSAGLNAPPLSLDPLQTTDSSVAFAVWHMYDSLLYLDTSGHFQPSLAKSVVSIDGGYIFTLRNDVTFHNGEMMNADSVIFSWERGNKLNLPPWTFASSIEKQDEYTVKVMTNKTEAEFLNSIVPAWIIVSNHNLSGQEPTEEQFRNQPVGTGPYRLIESSWISGTELSLEINSNYWQPLDNPISPVNFRYIPQDKRVTAIQEGTVKALWGLSEEERRLLNNENFLVDSASIRAITSIRTIFPEVNTPTEREKILSSNINNTLRYAIKYDDWDYWKNLTTSNESSGFTRNLNRGWFNPKLADALLSRWGVTDVVIDQKCLSSLFVNMQTKAIFEEGLQNAHLNYMYSDTPSPDLPFMTCSQWIPPTTFDTRNLQTAYELAKASMMNQPSSINIFKGTSKDVPDVENWQRFIEGCLACAVSPMEVPPGTDDLPPGTTSLGVTRVWVCTLYAWSPNSDLYCLDGYYVWV